MALIVWSGNQKICHRLKWDLLKWWIRFQFPSVSHISTATLATWLESGEGEKVVIIDARTPEEYEVSHLPQAQLISSDSPTINELREISASTPIVTYCSVGYRSALVAQRWQKQGFENVHNLEGSLFAWFNEARPVYRSGERVRQIHPYNCFWSLWLQLS